MAQSKTIGGRFGVLALLLAAILAGCAAPAATRDDRPHSLAVLTRGFTDRSFIRLTSAMDPAMLSVARRHDPARVLADLWGRPAGWGSYDLSAAPTLGFGPIGADQARRLNALLPVTEAQPMAARPFILAATGAERERAVLCLTQAIYFEAALEPRAGQEAVAQTVINRLRHPDFPHTVCGVVYQGAQQVTGCQFSFTCDGSRARGILPEIWRQSREVAEAALAGHVQPMVGTATFYHADYVFPTWGPRLVKIGQIGQHIFYRFPGPAGSPQAFSGRWSGGELRVSMEGPPAAEVAAIAEARAAEIGAGAPGTLLSIVDPSSANGLTTRVPGQVLFGRRAPTPQEIAEINRRLAEMEAHDPALATPNPDLEVSSAPWADPPRRAARTPADSPPSAADPATPASGPSP